MNCLVVGYGSIGKRHTQILQGLAHRVAVVGSGANDFALTYTNLKEALGAEAPDYIVIANETHRHYDTLKTLIDLDFQGIVMVEKPLFHQIKSLAPHSFKGLYVGYNLRFHPILQKLSSMLRKERILYAQVYVGQYLPNWRPNQDYRSSYSAVRAKGGGVLLDLSHELDYLQWFFGPWKRLVALGDRYGTLEIDSDDLWSLMLVMERCPVVQVQLNYLDPLGRREMIIMSENYSIRADLVKQTLEINDDIVQYKVARDDTYSMEHRAALVEKTDDLCSFQEGLEVLEMIEAAEKSQREGKWINGKGSRDQ